MVRTRKRAAARWLLAILALVVLAGIAFFALHNGSWRHFRTDLFSPRHPTAANRPCGSPLPALPGGAVAASRAAQFATIEQLHNSRPGVYRIQARLLGLEIRGAQIRLQLGSLVNPKLTVDALIPPEGCGATQEDTALYEELREVVSLRFGPLQPRFIPPSHATEVVAIGALVHTSGGLELRPLLDLHVQ
ncbi:MAG: hypothetical protein ACRD1C_12895 [Terriglobales bacterium]